MIGIFGGTFDPIHLGHLHLANTVQKKANLLHIKIIPCYQSPFRPPPGAPAKDRTAMIKLAINEHPHLQLDEREIHKSAPSYTINTIESIRSEIGSQLPLCLIMGDDVFAQFNYWHDWKKILKLAHIIVATRASSLQKNSFTEEISNILKHYQTFEAKDLTTKPSGYIWLVDIEPLDISATKIRTLIKNGQDTANFLPPAVWQYIKKHSLYLNF